MSVALAIVADQGQLVVELRTAEGTQRLVQLPGGGEQALGFVGAVVGAAITAAAQAGLAQAVAGMCPDCVLKARRAAQPKAPVILGPNGQAVQ